MIGNRHDGSNGYQTGAKTVAWNSDNSDTKQAGMVLQYSTCGVLQTRISSPIHAGFLSF